MVAPNTESYVLIALDTVTPNPLPNSVTLASALSGGVAAFGDPFPQIKASMAAGEGSLSDVISTYAAPDFVARIGPSGATAVVIQASASSAAVVGANGHIARLTSPLTASVHTQDGAGTRYIILNVAAMPNATLVDPLPLSGATTANQILLGSIYYDATAGLIASTLDFGPIQVLPSSQVALNVVQYSGGGTSGYVSSPSGLTPCTTIPAKTFFLAQPMLALVGSRTAGTITVQTGQSTASVETVAVIDGTGYAESFYQTATPGDFRGFTLDVVMTLSAGVHALTQEFQTGYQATVKWEDNRAYILLLRAGQVL